MRKKSGSPLPTYSPGPLRALAFFLACLLGLVSIWLAIGLLLVVLKAAGCDAPFGYGASARFWYTIFAHDPHGPVWGKGGEGFFLLGLFLLWKTTRWSRHLLRRVFGGARSSGTQS